MCVGWSPDSIDGRDYDYVGLAAETDLLYAMVYDTRSQIFGRCIASANTPLSTAQRGISRYLDLGIPLNKLVLGLPWYGYSYPCENASSDTDDFCRIAEVPFRGVNCSDATGSEITFASIMAYLDNGTSTTGRRWDHATQSPYYNYRDPATGRLHQMWYDDPESLQMKYAFARAIGVRGTGPYRWDQLDPTGQKTGNPR